MIDWCEDVNTTILRDGTNWEQRQGFISDTTRSGKSKRRMAHYMGHKPFTVKMRFTEQEYHAFDTWFETECCYGANSFRFPKIDKSGQKVFEEYQFADGGYPKYINVGGNSIECTMQWEKK